MVKSVPEIDIYVRLFETDALGHVNNISYYIYLEEARIKFLEYTDIYRLRNTLNENLQFLVVSSNCNYHKQAFHKQFLKINSRLTRIGKKSFTLEHDIFDAKTGEIIASGGAVMVCFDKEIQQSVEIPSSIRSVLEQYNIDNVHISQK